MRLNSTPPDARALSRIRVLVTNSRFDAHMVQALSRIDPTLPELVLDRAPTRAPSPKRLPITLKQNASTVEWVHGVLLRAIVSLTLPPGERLSRKLLAKWLGVSVTPVRDALLRLEAQNLVETRPQAETRVTLLVVPELHAQLIEREALEIEILRRLAKKPIAPVELRKLRQAIDTFEAAIKRAPSDAALDHAGLDAAFHAGLFDAAGLSNLFDALMRRQAPLQRCRNIVGETDTAGALACDFHKQILERIQAQDETGAVRAMRAHLSDDRAAIGQAIKLQPTWFT